MSQEASARAMQSHDLAQLPARTLKGVGPRIAERLERLGVRSVSDLLFHLPARYEDRTRVVPLGALSPGLSVSVAGEIEQAQVRFGRRRSLVIRLNDGTGSLELRFFHFRTSQQRLLARGVRLVCFGEVRRGSQGNEMVHPEYRVLASEDPVSVEEHLTPSYPTTQGLHQPSLRKLTEQALELLRASHAPADLLPVGILRSMGFPSLGAALQMIHRPPPEVSLELLRGGELPAQRRLAFEELLAHYLSLRLRRETLEREAAHPLASAGTLTRAFLSSLGFRLTEAQARVAEEIRNDLARPHPMQRLVQGDVGSGKTVIAALAALQALEAGYQVALMAPTELLAEQHLRNFSAWFGALDIEVGWLSGKLGPKQRSAVQCAISEREVGLIIGTHALFQAPITFPKLALIIVDEQHRFGVHQRMALLNKGQVDGRFAHQLIMTATPIPRTMAMAMHADLDTSMIDELPPGREPVETVVIPQSRRHEVVQRVHDACRRGQQAYWVCTLIEESETLQCQAATDAAAELGKALAGIAIGLIHGRLPPNEKEAVMRRFQEADLKLLVATSVIEVGVDVPNASLMIIENAERLGLAQLHQLRGRVGRGARKSVCVLMYRPPLSEAARIRLKTLRETNDGFEIAARDLELRGPGEVLGARQTGMVSLRIADLIRDQAMLPAIEKCGSEMLRAHRARVAPLIERWVGGALDYADV